MSETLRVGISEIKVADFPNKLRTAGLGSCVGIVLFDPKTRVAGMIHSMLPDHSISPQKTLPYPGKYVDTAIPNLLAQLNQKGIRSKELRAKMAGGAEMFKLSEQSMSRIGYRNVCATKEILAHYQIPLIAEETGGNFGRTIEFDTSTNQLYIRTASEGERFI